MKKLTLIKVFLTLLLLAALLIPIGPLASLGALLNPYSGIWIMTHNDFEFLPAKLKMKLKQDVKVDFEKTGIPHIFAKNDSDLYFVQGYLQARDRLWEMDFFSRLAAGRLSEIFGKKTYPVDESFVQLRIPEAALASVRIMLDDPQTKLALESFANGVNFYIDQLQSSDLPLEFKLLNYKPELWSPLKTALIAKFMAFSLSGSSKDLQLTRTRKLFNESDFNELFPEQYNYRERIISENHKWKSKSLNLKVPKATFMAELQNQKLKFEPHPGNGSNNWAVFAKKSSTGFPILSNDIHLDYSMPALWYQNQLITPSQNIYGASLVGAPGVIVGFSKKFAWGVTNASGDFMDWYEVKFQDPSHQKYLFEGNWKDIQTHEHLIFIKGEKPRKLILKDTHFGPLIFDDDQTPGINNIPHGLALRWSALKASNELKSLLKLNQAQLISVCENGFEEYVAPSQNFICADSNGGVRIGEQGEFSRRYKGQGRFVSDGSTESHQWGEKIPQTELPFETNPARNFVFSANQQPMNKDYPNYLGHYYEPPFRAQRIHQILDEKASFTPEEIVDMQKDTFNKLAEKILPNLLSVLGKLNLAGLEKTALEELSKWNLKNELNSVGASIFERLWGHLEYQIWENLIPDRINYLAPNQFITSEIIKHDLNSKWLGSKNLKFSQILNESFSASIRDLEKIYGQNIHLWLWRKESIAKFNHLSRLPIFATHIESAGNRYNILANRTNHGPVWKMVVSLEPNFRAWAIYPGGQSSDIRSPHAKEFLKDWAESNLRAAQYLEEPSALSFKSVHFVGEK